MNEKIPTIDFVKFAKLFGHEPKEWQLKIMREIMEARPSKNYVVLRNPTRKTIFPLGTKIN